MIDTTTNTFGVLFGRKAKLTKEQVNELNQKRSQGVLIKDLMIKYRLSKSAFIGC